MLDNLKDGAQVLMYFDFHGHSLKRSVFVYGPELFQQDWRAYEAKVVPLAMAMRSEMFNYKSCSFVINEAKNSTARVQIFKFKVCRQLCLGILEFIMHTQLKHH